ncbi:MAG: bifunctional DNA-formamidopyrimidine glycosylase/DNA-(apurinic or apyrimidinic site) lyase [Acidobacteriota bacterium]
MPELPEVELVVRSLDRLVNGQRFKDAQLLRERLAPAVSPSDFTSGLKNAVVISVGRRGKHILFSFDNGRTLIVHLRMSGRFLLLPDEASDPKFVHACFHLSGGGRLVFEDQRHFGYMHLAESGALETCTALSKLAPEPFSPDFSPLYFRGILRASKRPLKEFLLDQTKVTGLGNIYAAEALFLSRIHPAVPANTLSPKRSERLFNNIRGVLQEAIDAGSTLNTDPENYEIGYYGGRYEDHWRVYGREGLPCVECGRPVRRLKQGGRSTFFCSKCQRR